MTNLCTRDFTHGNIRNMFISTIFIIELTNFQIVIKPDKWCFLYVFRVKEYVQFATLVIDAQAGDKVVVDKPGERDSLKDTAPIRLKHIRNSGLCERVPNR